MSALDSRRMPAANSSVVPDGCYRRQSLTTAAGAFARMKDPASPSLESLAEGGKRFVADAFRDLGHGQPPFAKQRRSGLHPPPSQVGERRTR